MNNANTTQTAATYKVISMQTAPAATDASTAADVRHASA